MEHRNWDRHVKKCLEEWHKRFHYLKGLPTYHSFLTMLGLASSVKHLERLHQTLPDNFPLNQSHWVRLVNFWKEFFTGPLAEKFRGQLEEWLLFEQGISWEKVFNKFPEARKGPTEKSFWDIFSHVRITSNSSSLYIRYIWEKSLGGQLVNFFDNGRECSPKFAIKSNENVVGDCHSFYVRLFGELLKAELFLSSDCQHLMFRFGLKQNLLTEKFVHQITTELPPYCLWRYGVASCSSFWGVYLYPSFEVKSEDLLNYLTKIEGPCNEYFVVKQDFFKPVTEVLRKNGISVEGDLSPVVISKPEKEK